MKTSFSHTAVAAALVAATLALPVHAQPVSAPTEDSVTLLQTVEPSFRVEPVVHRFKARRGALIPFEFAIASTGKPLDIEVRPVNLRQEETGLILHDEQSDPSDIVKLHSETSFQLAPGESRSILGEITVPLPKTNFLSFGILVKDKGTKPSYDDSNPAATQAGIRFVTQYVLRVDVEIESAPTSELANLRFAKGDIVSRNGNPVVQTILENPTNYAFEFQVRASIEMENASSRPKPFLIGMLSRVDMEEPDRFLIRMMPNSRLRLEAPLKEPILPGPAFLNFGISNGRREIAGAGFAVETSHGEFAAVDAQVAFVSKATSISPAYVELGQVKGKPRVAPLRVLNRGENEKQFEVRVTAFDGSELSGVTVSPKSFSVGPGRSKTLRAMLRSNRRKTQPEFGLVHITATAASGEQTTTHLPLAMFYGEPGKPNLTVSPVELSVVANHPVFTVEVENNGEGFVPINAQLIVASAQARRLALTAGYGRWIKPGEKYELKFAAERALEPGEYQLALQLQTHPGQAPIERTVNVRLSASGADDSVARAVPANAN